MFETVPLKTLDELLEWNPPQFGPRSTLPPPRFDRGKKNKVLFCHDMMGGYLEDRFHLGDTKVGYSFCHWDLIDVFVYFSHHFVTIPPAGWIESSRKNSVPILGTFITEGSEGGKICRKIFSDEAVMQVVVAQLVEIARYFGLSGWLINIENDLKRSHVPLVVEMLGLLSLNLKRACADPVVVWYDSVLKSGQLQLQNEVNERNRVFLEGNDVFIFTNYWWGRENLERMARGEFSQRVFVGVDVFGRGVRVGGPGFDIFGAVEMAFRHVLSVALFAPGWTWENFGEREDYWDFDRRFWGSLRELSDPRPYCLPFKSSFCRGFGESTWVRGERVGVTPWYNIGLQQLQLNAGDSGKVQHVNSLGFSGGSCLCLSESTNILRFSSEFSRLCIVCYVGGNCDVGFAVETEGGGDPGVEEVCHFVVGGGWVKKVFLVTPQSLCRLRVVSLNVLSTELVDHPKVYLGQLEIFDCADCLPRIPLTCPSGFCVTDMSLTPHCGKYVIRMGDSENVDHYVIWREAGSLQYVGRTFVPFYLVDRGGRFVVEAVPY